MFELQDLYFLLIMEFEVINHIPAIRHLIKQKTQE